MLNRCAGTEKVEE